MEAFKCDLTGKMQEGSGALNFGVLLPGNLKLTITPHVSKDGRNFTNGVFSQDAVNAVTKALQDVFGKPENPDASKPVPR